MVCVIVDDDHAIAGGKNVEAPAHAAKCAERACNLCERNLEMARYGNRRKCVEDVDLAGHAQFDCSQTDIAGDYIERAGQTAETQVCRANFRARTKTKRNGLRSQ